MWEGNGGETRTGRWAAMLDRIEVHLGIYGNVTMKPFTSDNW